MTSSHTGQPSAKRRGCFRLLLIGCAPLLLITCIAVAALLSPGTVLRLFNFDRRGDLETFWHELEPEVTQAILLPPVLREQLPTATRAPTLTPTRSAPLAAQPTVTEIPLIADPTELPFTPETPTPTPTPTSIYQAWFRTSTIPEVVLVKAEGYMNLSFHRTGLFANAIWVGESYVGQQLGILEFEETAVEMLCELYFNNCRTPFYRVDRVDFRRGGMVVYGGINVGFWWQDVGVALVLNPDNRSLRFAGVLLDEELYAPPTQGRIADVINDLVTRGNAALQQLTIQADAYTLHFSEMWFDEDRFVAVLQ